MTRKHWKPGTDNIATMGPLFTIPNVPVDLWPITLKSRNGNLCDFCGHDAIAECGECEAQLCDEHQANHVCQPE